MADVHNRTRYLAGCRCEVCKAAQSLYRKERRQKQNADKATSRTPRPIASVPDLPAESQPAVESVTAAVERELAFLSTTSERPGLAAAARAMAQVLDSPAALPQHPAAAGRLAEILAVLGKGGRSRKGKLAAVREMTNGA